MSKKTDENVINWEVSCRLQYITEPKSAKDKPVLHVDHDTHLNYISIVPIPAKDLLDMLIDYDGVDISAARLLGSHFVSDRQATNYNPEKIVENLVDIGLDADFEKREKNQKTDVAKIALAAIKSEGLDASDLDKAGKAQIVAMIAKIKADNAKNAK